MPDYVHPGQSSPKKSTPKTAAFVGDLHLLCRSGEHRTSGSLLSQQAALCRRGERKSQVLFHLMSTTRRFNELRRLIPNVTQRMLTLQRRELETDLIIHRKVYLEVPPEVEYSLTPLGLTLVPLLTAMRGWGATHQAIVLAYRRAAQG